MRYIFLMLLAIIPTQVITAEPPYSPLPDWSFPGTYSMHKQPAEVAAHHERLIFDLNLFSVNLGINNSFYKIKRSFFKGLNADNLSEKTQNIREDYLVSLNRVKNHKININTDVRLLELAIPITENDAIGLSFRARAMVSMAGADPVIYDVIEREPFVRIGSKYGANNLSVRASSWAELNLNYGRTILDEGDSRLYGGIALKFIQPVMGAFVYFKEGSYHIGDPRMPIAYQGTYELWVNATGRAALPQFVTGFNKMYSPEEILSSIKFGKNITLGTDIGAIYEFGESEGGNYQTRYKFRIGAALLDLGVAKFQSDWTTDIKMNQNASDLFEEGIVMQSHRLQDLDMLHDAFSMENKPTKYRISLPTRLNISSDFHIWDGFFLAANAQYAMRHRDFLGVGVNELNYLEVIPRFERWWFSAGVPLYFDEMRAMNVGLDLKLGPLWIYSNNLFSMLLGNSFREINLGIGMRFCFYKSNGSSSGGHSGTSARRGVPPHGRPNTVVYRNCKANLPRWNKKPKRMSW